MPQNVDIYNWTAYASGLYYSNDQDASSDVYTAMKEMSFESGTPPAEAQGTSGFVDAWANMQYSSAQASQGTQSARLQYPIGAEGFGICGAENSLTFADTAQYGEEFWLKTDVFIPTASSIYTSAGYLKTLRLKPYHPTDIGEGVHDFLLRETGFTIGNEAADIVTAVAPNITDSAYTKGAWFTMEAYVKLHLTTGIVRFWLDDTLIHEELNIKTCEQSDSYMGIIWFGSNWNHGAPMTLTGITGTFGVGNTISSGNEGGGTAGASFADIYNNPATGVYQIVPVGTSAGQTGGYGLAAGDVITDTISGATGTLARTYETQYFDNIIFASSRKGTPTARDASSNAFIGSAKVAV